MYVLLWYLVKYDSNQPLQFEVKKKLISRSERVKSVELHPDLPWVLVGLFSGNVTIYDHQSQSIVKTIEVSQSPVRNAKFIVRRQMIAACSDDLYIRVYNYNTMEKVKQLEAHSDYIRYITVHPTQPYLLSSSDDSTIKIWDMDNNFSLVRTLDDHINYVMMLSLNPRDPNTFASASLDKTIKIWTLQTNSTKANFTLTGHSMGVNCVDYFKGDKPYLISGADDRLIKIWDYQTKQCIHTLEGHQQNISCAAFHPELPLIISTAEDGAIRFWHSQTYKLETTLNYNMERIWALDISKDNSNLIAFGFDDGTVVVKIGSDEPVVSMNSGKVVYAKNMEFFTLNLKAVNTSDPEAIKDGQTIQVNQKELGMSDIYPIGITHSPNGHLFGIYSDREYSIYRTQTFKNAGFGQGTSLVWSPTGDYAVADFYSIKVYRGSNNQLAYELKTDYVVEALSGGALLGARSTDFIIFYHWETAKIIRKIDVAAKKVIWNDNFTLCTLLTQDEIYLLKFRVDLMDTFLSQEEEVEGFEDAFEPIHDLAEQANSGAWIASVFYFTTSAGKIAYTINGKVFPIDTDKKAFIIGYLQQQNRLYLIDKHFNIISYEVNHQVAEFQSLLQDNEIQKATELLVNIPEKYHDKLAKFLDQIGQKQLAFQLSADPEHRFDLAIQLGRVQEAFELVSKQGNSLKLRQIGDLALQQANLELAIEAYELAEDLASLFLIYSSLGLREHLQSLATKAVEQTKMNIAFQCYFTLGDAHKCHEVLIKSKQFPEAALFAKTYCPSKIDESVQQWKQSLAKSHPVISQKIANPFDFPEQYSDLNICLQIEQFYKDERLSNDVPSHFYQQYQDLLNYDIFSMLKQTPDYSLQQFTLQPENVTYDNPLLN